jgi:predicted ester cyclase
MCAQEKKAVLARLIEDVFHGGNADALDELFRSDAVIHDPGVELQGLEALRAGIRGLHTAFPDFHVTVFDPIVEGDMLATRYRGEATHRGEFHGIPATGRRIGYGGMLMVRFAGDRIAEYWAQPDLLAILRQLGALPEPAPIEANKQLARRWLDLVTEHRVEDICRITAPSWRMHGGPPELPAGPDGVRALFRAIGPIDQRWTIDDVIAEGDRVAVRATNTCVQDSFFGVDGRGKRQIFTATFVHRIADGKMLETWRNASDLERLLQLGARIEPAPAGADSSP